MTKKNIRVDFLNSMQKEILTGLMLGDLHCGKRHLKGNASLHFGTSLFHYDYIMHLYDLFKDFCGSWPKIFSYLDKRNNKVYKSVRFKTLSSFIFEETFNMFYDNEKKKIIPRNLFDLLTPVALAYWAMDDGSKNGPGFHFNTHCFSRIEINLVREILMQKFNIQTSIHKNTKSEIIYIKSSSMNDFLRLVSPFFHHSMLYKLK